MSTTITTSRLTLRHVQPTDAQRITDLVNNPQIYRMVSRISSSQSHAQTLGWISGHDAGRAADTDHPYAIVLDGELIGMTGAHREVTLLPFEIGYWLAPEHWGQGIMTEAAEALLKWLQEHGEQAFVSGYFIDNPASGRVLGKLGFMKADRRQVFCLGRGEAVEHYDMARVA